MKSNTATAAQAGSGTITMADIERSKLYGLEVLYEVDCSHSDYDGAILIGKVTTCGVYPAAGAIVVLHGCRPVTREGRKLIQPDGSAVVRLDLDPIGHFRTITMADDAEADRTAAWLRMQGLAR